MTHVLRVFRFLSQEEYFFYPIWRIISPFRKPLQFRKDALLSAWLKEYFEIAWMLGAYWRAVVTVIPILSKHRFTVALFPTKSCKMSRRKKGLCNVSSALGLHHALIAEDKNPNTVNLSFMNRFGPFIQGYFTRTLFGGFFTYHMLFIGVCVFYYWKDEVLFFKRLKGQTYLQS